MKLATIPDGSRDGALVVVLQDKGLVARVPARITPNLRTALEQWAAVEPELRRIERQAHEGRWPEVQPVADMEFLAPLPRTTSWLDGSAFIQHILLVRKARNAEPPSDLRTVPLMYQGVGDPLLAPRAPIEATSEEHGIDLEAEVAVILDDTPQGTAAADAARHIKLLVLLNDVSLRGLIPRELAAGFGFFHGKPPSSLGPFAVTPDELGAAWREGRLHLPIRVEVNGQRIGEPDCGEMFFSFPQLIEHASRTRPLPAGTILGSGTVSNADESRGCGCLAEVRTLETIKTGAPLTPFLRFGDRVRIEVRDGGRSVFGAIEQEVRRHA
ncbi:MAG TPA: fumarylacetoacetate hydrolase family protein [Candidatus Thermoplasmatota archaeon]|nr:fumarylacetoacetate hydrolase family protein [Candidatus Thermoplasmatota archaeon]